MQSRRMKAFLGVAMLALLALVAMPGKGEDDGAASPVAVAHLAAPAPVALPPAASSRPGDRKQESVQAVLERQRARSAELTWGRDPFAGPVVVVPEAAPEALPLPKLPRLSGVSAGGSVRRAILDREIVGAGDALPSGWTVQLIEQGLVTLRFGNQVRILQLRDDP